MLAELGLFNLILIIMLTEYFLQVKCVLQQDGNEERDRK